MSVQNSQGGTPGGALAFTGTGTLSLMGHQFLSTNVYISIGLFLVAAGLFILFAVKRSRRITAARNGDFPKRGRR